MYVNNSIFLKLQPFSLILLFISLKKPIEYQIHAVLQNIPQLNN